MLGRTAGGLFWMFRYLERAENTARLLDAGWRINLTRSTDGSNEWQSILTTAGSIDAYQQKYDDFDTVQVINYILRDPDNPASLKSAVESARQNARMVRTALSSEVWEATNECWIALKSALTRPVTERTLFDTLSLIRNRTAVVRGMLHGTMLRNDIFAFSRLGTFVERADNTARILDMKYYVLLPSATFVGTSMDNVQWEVILRSVSAERSYRWLYAGEATALGIAEFLLLDSRMPRSLAFCHRKIEENVADLAREYGVEPSCYAVSQRLNERIRQSTITSIFDDGLHEFLGDFLTGTNALAQQIETDFRFYA